MLGRFMGAPAERGVRWWRWTAVVLSAVLVAVMASLVLDHDVLGFGVPQYIGLTFAFFSVVGTGLAVRASRHRNSDRTSRRAWGFMAVAYLVLGVSGALRRTHPIGVAATSIADLLRLSFPPLMLTGLLTLPLRTHGHRERYKVWLDTVVVVVAGAMVLWYVEVGPRVEGADRIDGGRLAAAIAYPVLDLMLLFGAAVVLFRGAAASARGPAALLGLAMVTIVAGDASFGYRQSHLGEFAPGRWQLACWLAGHFLLTMAALVQCRRASRDRIHHDDVGARSISVVPYLAVALSYLLLLLAVRGQHLRVLGLVIGALVMTAVVVARQVVALRQNHELVVTDPVTGLVNRRQLYDRLNLALSRSDRNVALLVLDISGFKHVNDTMGHEAGDQLLVAVGQIMCRNVLGGDVVGRLGGDEFAVVLHNIDTLHGAVAVARRILTDMQTPVMIVNTPVQPRVAIGIALSGPGRLTAEELLDDADLAMCWAKRHPTANVATYPEYVAGSMAEKDGWMGLEPNAPYRRQTRPR